MAKFILQLLVLVCVAHMTFAAVAIALPNPKYPGQCFDGKKTYEVGTYYPENSCMRIYCHGDFSMTFQTCGSVGVPKGYKNVPDYTLKYPKCCVNIIKAEDEENIIE